MIRMEVRRRRSEPFGVVSYVAVCTRRREGVIVDPGGDPEKILDMVREMGATVRYILNTHMHPDHTRGNVALSKALSVPVAAHKADVEFFSTERGQEASRRELGMPPAESPDMALSDGQVLQVGDVNFIVLHTPGHTPGSACFYAAGELFTGDTLFVGDMGRTDLTGGSLEDLKDSIRAKLFPLPRETVIHPGHDFGGPPWSTLGVELRRYAYLTEFAED